MRGLFEDLGVTIGTGTSGIANDAEDGKVEKLVHGPCMGTGRDSIDFPGEDKEDKDAARKAIGTFCDELEPGYMILFNLGPRNNNSDYGGDFYGDVDHVVMYAGQDPETGEHMIVESISDDDKVYYRPISELVFKENWQGRLPVFAVSYLTDAQQKSLTVPGV